MLMALSNPKPRMENCSDHGQYESQPFVNPFTDKIMHWSKCPQCAKIEEEEKRRREAEERKQEKLDRLHSKLKRAGIPARFLDKTFADYQTSNDRQARVMAKCQKYAERFELVLEKGVCMALIGNSGTGKNHLAMSIANQIIRAGYTAHYDDVYMLLSDIKHAQKNSEERETAAIKALSEPDLLIIDEVGDQVGSDADKRLLNKIFNQRYADKRPTIILSNLTVDELKTVLGTRIINRLSENSGRILVFDWESHRGKIKCDDIWG